MGPVWVKILWADLVDPVPTKGSTEYCKLGPRGPNIYTHKDYPAGQVVNNFGHPGFNGMPTSLKHPQYETLKVQVAQYVHHVTYTFNF